MIHEEKLNGALNRFSFPRFRSSRPCTTVPYPSVYGIDYLSFPSVYLSIHFYRSAFMLSHDLLFFFLSVCLSVYQSIYLSRLFTRLSVCLLSYSLPLLSWQTILSLLSLADDISTIWYCIPEIHQNFLTCLESGIRINRTSVKEANLSSVVMYPLHFPFRLFAKPCGNFVTSNRCNRGQTKLRFFWFRHYKLHIIASFGAVKYRSFQAIYTR